MSVTEPDSASEAAQSPSVRPQKKKPAPTAASRKTTNGPHQPNGSAKRTEANSSKPRSDGGMTSASPPQKPQAKRPPRPAAGKAGKPDEDEVTQVGEPQAPQSRGVLGIDAQKTVSTATQPPSIAKQAGQPVKDLGQPAQQLTSQAKKQGEKTKQPQPEWNQMEPTKLPDKKDAKKVDPKDEQERQREKSKAATTALKWHRKATQLTAAAAAAADPEERQHLLNEALKASINSESFGKVAKWLNSGAFQGFLVGGGLGTGIGMTLGTLVGVLVGGLTSLILGGLGGLGGMAVGALHGPWFKLEDIAGAGIRKITGDLPGWKATDAQKAELEHMLGMVNAQDRPSLEELEAMTREQGMAQDLREVESGRMGWGGYAMTWVPGKGWFNKEEGEEQKKALAKGGAGVGQGVSSQVATQKGSGKSQGGKSGPTAPNANRPTTEDANRIKDAASKPTEYQASTTGSQTSTAQRTPQKPEGQGASDGQNGATTTATPKPKKQPRKLQVRGQKSKAN